MKYQCLLLDHDDTAVDSTASIHYPAHVEVIRKMRPATTPVSLEGWFEKNFDPGILEYLVNELEFSREELDAEYRIWKRHAEERVPRFYPGVIDALKIYRRGGGKVVVVSHSIADIIRRDFAAGGFEPDLVYGWDFDESKRKPNPWPVTDAAAKTGLPLSRLLVVDDLRPGVLMARAAGVDAAAAGWGHRIPRIERYMREHCVAYFADVEEFARYIIE